MGVLEYGLLVFSVLAGGAVAFWVKNYSKKTVQLVLSFSGAYILGITVLHLMPGIFQNQTSSIPMGIWILAGFFLQLILEQLSSGVEHGHIHASDHLKSSMVFTIMLGLCIHAIMEGLPLEGYDQFHQSTHRESHGHHHFLYGIVLHKAPAAFALAFLLLLSQIKPRLVVLYLIIFAMMTPLGAAIGHYLELDLKTYRVLIAIVVGSFLHIATTILFEVDSTHHHRISWEKMLTIILGLGISIMTIN